MAPPQSGLLTRCPVQSHSRGHASLLQKGKLRLNLLLLRLSLAHPAPCAAQSPVWAAVWRTWYAGTRQGPSESSLPRDGAHTARGSACRSTWSVAWRVSFTTCPGRDGTVTTERLWLHATAFSLQEVLEDRRDPWCCGWLRPRHLHGLCRIIQGTRWGWGRPRPGPRAEPRRLCDSGL